jgi:EAL domain-containing protein (putative c-di-GMP-specific phosphodiesterase class I)
VEPSHPRADAADEFIHIAETTGSIVSIGRWVVDRVCNHIRAWREQGVTPPVIAIDLSGAQFKLATDIGRTVEDAIARAGIGPEQLELEQTETMLMEPAQKHNEALTQLRRLGVRLAIDDFGTGYSSLDYLRSFQPSRLKIDRRFVGDVKTSTDDAAIVRAIIGLAGELGIEVGAEGMEIAGQRDFLLSAGCRLAQDNYFSAPVPLPNGDRDAAAEPATPTRPGLVLDE